MTGDVTQILNAPNNTFGIVTAQNNQPREAHFALRLRF